LYFLIAGIAVGFATFLQVSRQSFIFWKMAALGPEVYSASNRNEYQKHKNNHFSGE
jgi:hypothetical protein